jgi:hypothetical protein
VQIFSTSCLLFGCTRGGFELGKQFFYLAMVGLQQGNGTQMVCLGISFSRIGFDYRAV